LQQVAVYFGRFKRFTANHPLNLRANFSRLNHNLLNILTPFLTGLFTASPLLGNRLAISRESICGYSLYQQRKREDSLLRRSTRYGADAWQRG